MKDMMLRMEEDMYEIISSKAEEQQRSVAGQIRFMVQQQLEEENKIVHIE